MLIAETDAPAKDKTLKELMRERALSDFYYFIKEILLYKDLVPHFHGSLCAFIQQTEAPNEMSRRLILLPRSTFKSTIATIAYPMWRLARDPDLRIMIISDTEKNATRFLREIKNHFEHNKTFRSTFPEMIPPNFNTATWSQTEMVVNSRTAVWREPSIDAIGMGGGAESRHYDLIIGDDTITEKAIYSDTEMDKAIEWTGGLESLLVKPDDEIFWIGSRKRLNDLYDAIIGKFGGKRDAKETPIGPHAIRKGDMLIFSRSAIENGKPVFPERIPLKFLNRLAETDPHRYNSQYANNPIASGLNFFRPQDIRFFEWSDRGQIILPDIDGLPQGPISPFYMERMVIYDPSKAEKETSSKQGILTIAKGDGPIRFVLDAEVSHIPPDEAIDILFELYTKWKPGVVAIEHRGFQGSIKYWLDERTQRDGMPHLPVIEWPFAGSEKAIWSKIERIRGLIPMFRAGYVYLAPELRNSELHEELLYYPNVKWDDGVDAMSMSLDFWPWMSGAEEIAAFKSSEDQLLEEMLGYTPKTVGWDEQSFLAGFDQTGYGFILPAAR